MEEELHTIHITLPESVGIVTATKGDRLVNLSWNAVSNNTTIIGYLVEKSIDSISWTNDILLNPTTSYTSSNLDNGVLYYFRVSAKNNVGIGASSDIVSAVPSIVSSELINITPMTRSASINNENSTIITYTFIGNPNLINNTAYKFTVTANNINGSSAPSNESNPIIPVTIPNTISGNRNLINGEPYYFNVTANNTNGSSIPSDDSNSIITSVVPDAPNTVTCISENTQVVVSWIAPTNNGGSVITSYTVINDAGVEPVTTLNGTITSVTVTGLTNGTPYIFTVFATNINGDSLPSTPSSEIIPSTVPDKPTNVSAIPGNTEATIYWSPPISNGGSAITKYTVTSDPGGLTAISTSSSTTRKGLTNGIPYRFTVIATNSKGDSDNSTQSNQIIPATTPNAPTTITCTTGDMHIDLSWNIPNNGGSEITYYNIQYSSNNGTNWTDISSNTNYKSITGLTNGTPYIFRIAAHNIIGTSSYSSNTSEHIPFNNIEPPYITNSEIGNNSASIFFTQSNTSGYPITKYKYTLDNGVLFIEKDVNHSPIFISNINNGTQYNIKISAYAQSGWSNLSNEISITPIDNRTTEIKTAITNLTSTTITNLKNQLFTEISSISTDKKIQIINSVALDISNQPQDLRISTLLNISLNIDYSSNSIKSNLNTLMIDAGIVKNVPYVISDPVLVNQIISDVSYKSIYWEPTTLSVIIPTNNNTLTIDFNNPDSILLFIPGVTYNVNGTYLGSTSYNSFNVIYNRTDISRYLRVNNLINKQIGDTIMYNFPNIQLNFKINMLGSIGGRKILVPAGAGDPHILTINGDSYMLPHDENCYLLYDNNIENDRVLITAKCWFLPKNIIDNSTFRNNFMDNTTFFKYININYNGENLTFDMETLKPVKYTNIRNLRNNKLEFISNETKINMTELFEDKLVFKNQYSKIKLRKYKINFDGKSRIIELENGYKFKLSFDLNCADHRNEIKILEANYNDSCGALINEDVKNSIKYFIPKN